MVHELDLETLVLDRGKHKSPADGMCALEAASLIAGEPFSDHPRCVSPVIAAFMRRWDDNLDFEDRQQLKPFIRKVIGTNTGRADEETRKWLVVDWMVRTCLPAWLRLANLDAQADAVSSLKPLLNADSWDSCKSVVFDAKAAADAARDAARDAAWRATGPAAWDAAWAAAWAADAARDAARDAAWAAAWAADADGDTFTPTVRELHESAFDLLNRLISVGK
jgi:hypothetical protein